MSPEKEPDRYDWFGALRASAEQAARLVNRPVLGPEARCLCGSSDTRGRILAKPIDMTDADMTVQTNEGGRHCHACQHYIPHGAMRVTRYFHDTTTVRDHFHPECVEI